MKKQELQQQSAGVTSDSKGLLKQGLYLQQGVQKQDAQKPASTIAAAGQSAGLSAPVGALARPAAAGAAAAVGLRAGLSPVAYRRSVGDEAKGTAAAGRVVLTQGPPAGATAGSTFLSGATSAASLNQQQLPEQLPPLHYPPQLQQQHQQQVNRPAGSAGLQPGVQVRDVGPGRGAIAAVTAAAAVAAADRPGAVLPERSSAAAGRGVGGRPPSGKLPALQHPQLQQQQQQQHAGALPAPLSSRSRGPAVHSAGHVPKHQQQPQQQQQHKHHRDPYTDPEVLQRTSAWLQLMQDMQTSAEGDIQFVYLRYAWPQQLPFNPFDLEVCTHAEAVAAGRYFTMSPSGVTCYSPDGSRPEFMSLNRWQREHTLHMQLLQLPLFRQHKRWKAFNVWRKAIRDFKSSNCVEKLSKGLLLLDPLMQQAVYAVRRACLEVEAQQLSCLQPGQALSLPLFAEQHAARLEQCQQQLGRVYADAVATAESACVQALEALQQEMLGTAAAAGVVDITVKAGPRGASDTADHSKPKAQTAAAAAAATAGGLPVQLLNDSYAMQATRRALKRRLCDMTRLLDYMLSDAVHTMLVRSLQQLLQCLSGSNQNQRQQQQQQQEQQTGPGLQQQGPQQQPQQRQVVLSVELLLHDQHDQLYLQPQAADFVEALAVWLRGVERAVRGLPRLLASPKLRAYMELTGDVAPGSQHSPDGLVPQMLGEDFEHLSQALEAGMQSCLSDVQHYMAGYGAFKAMVVTNRAFSGEAVQQAVNAQQLGLPGLRQLVLMYQQQLADVRAIPTTADVGVMQVCLSKLVQSLAPSPLRCLQELQQLLPRLAAACYGAFISRVRGYSEALSRPPSSPEEFVAHAALIAEVEAARPAMDKDYDQVTGFFELLEEFNIQAPAEDLAAAACLDAEYAALRDTVWAAEAAKERHAEAFRLQLEAQAAELVKEVARLRVEGEQEAFVSESSDLIGMIEATSKLLQQVVVQQEAAAHLSELSVECGGPPLVLQELESLAEEMGLKHMMWTMQQELAQAGAAWMQGPLFELDVADMQAKVDTFSRQVHRLERGLVPNSLVPKLRDEVARWQELLGPVSHLRNPLLRERHWQAITDVLGGSIDRAPGATTCITQLINMQVLEHKEALAAISNEAVQMAALEELLAQVTEKWRNVEFVVKRVKAAKDNFILGEVDDVMQVLEDSKITVSMILSSRYVGGIKPEVDRMDAQLQLFSATLESWLLVQRGWLKLEAVFAAPDIQRQVPAEAAAFAQVDKTFKDIMRRTHDRPNALQCGTTPGWLESFNKCAETLEAVQKGLKDYLETKRVAFPRWYFLSNDELLDILRQAKNPHAVQPHLPKCFEGLRCLVFASGPGQHTPQHPAAGHAGVPSGDGPAKGATAVDAGTAQAQAAAGPAEGAAAAAAASNDILAMLSPEGEQVPFGRVLKARGLVESWLSNVEAHMRLSLKALVKKALKEYSASRRPAWALAQPAQLALLAANTHWCQEVQAALQGSQGTAAKQLQQLHGRCMLQLEDLVELVRGPLADLERKSVVALITADVHNRDVVGSLLQKRVSRATDFAWQMQLRFEFDPDADSILVRQVNARFSYGFEYLGAAPRLVVTPMTDRCFLTLTGALALRLGGAPSGPAGTGKTESVKDLGRALGMQCVVFNCSENLDHMFTSKFFRGLAQCGAWACLDEFNRMEIEVLSVVAQQLHALQSALRSGADKLLLDGRDLALQPSCGVFVTQNPSTLYAGRTELPDNLKVLFRPIAMTAPDYQLIAEVLLFGEGFSEASWLAGKVVHLYRLATQQLSQQGYDFGTRALKAVLIMAGSLKRASPHEPEAVVMIRALQDANLPKLLTEDIVLFKALIADLFPDTQLPQPSNPQLYAALADACAASGLQPEPAFTDKAIQLHDTLGVRFGVMLVGPAGGGKTACYRSLQAAQTYIMQHNAGASEGSDAHSIGVQAHVLNPKSISLAELYGSFNPVTSEWTDGLASRLVRAAVADDSPNMHLLVFDGPCETEWVESMNTALDDNRMLCLSSGERMRLDESRMRLLFEVEDLVAASPATVSRCGIVYMPSDVLGWRPAAVSWLDQYLARHAAITEAAATQAAAAAAAPEAVAPAAPALPSEASQLATPGSPTLPGFGRAGCDSFNAAARASTSAAAASASANAVSMQCPEGMRALRDCIRSIFDKFAQPLLQWVKSKGSLVLPLSEAALMASLTTLFEIQLNQLYRSGQPVLDPAVSESQVVLLQYVFAYAAVWGIGGCLAASCWDAWDKAVRAVFDGCANYPAGAGSVFDYFVDTSRSPACFARWDVVVPAFTYQQQQPMHAVMVPTVDTCRYGSLLRGCLAAGKPVMLVGGPGVGKSAVIKEGLEALRAQLSGKLESAVLNCSAFTTSATAQQLLESSLVKRGHCLGPPSGHNLAVFIDDIHLPEPQQYGATPAHEMLRLLLDRGGLFQRKSLMWRRVLDTVLVAASGTPTRGRAGISQRLTRHMTCLAMPAPTEGVLRSICTAVLGGFLGSRFTPDVHSRMLRPLVEGCVEVYSAVCASLLPTPSRSHYCFNFRDMGRVLQGLLSIAPAACGGDVPVALTRLWVHEVQRVFGDRLVCDEDRAWLRGLQQELLVSKFGWQPGPKAADNPQGEDLGLGLDAGITSHMPVQQHQLQQAPPPKQPVFGAASAAQLCVASDALFEGPDQVLFGDFSKIGVALTERAYEPLTNANKLAAVLERYLDEYNASGGRVAAAAAGADDAGQRAGAAADSGGQKRGGAGTGSNGPGSRLDLVLFQDAVLHVVRLARVLRQPRGSALLVGVGGSGKQSIAKFAAFVAGHALHTVSMAAGYNLARFRGEVKEVLKVAGVEGRHVVFLVTDNNITDEAMLADINGLLNTGEVTGLFSPEEQALLLDQLHPWLATQPELRPGRNAAWEAFTLRAQHHLHIVFATSPVGAAFRTCCRQFPSLVNCMTVDWFSPWPAQALLGVGIRALEGLNLTTAPTTQPAQSAASASGAASSKPVAAAAAAGSAAAASSGSAAGSGSIDSIVLRVAQVCVEVHKGMEEASEQLWQEQQRRCYVTPRSYLDLLAQYATLLTASRTELGDKRRRLLDGIAKLNETSTTLDSMRSQLNDLQPLLAEKAAATSTLLQQVRDEQAEAQSVAATVAAEEAEVLAQAARCKALKDDAAAELAAVLPALEAAVHALDSLNKADIIEMKTFIKPPALVQLTMEGVCILLQENGTDWDAAKRVLGDAGFIARLIEYDKDNITEKVRRELKSIISNPAFTPEQVGQQSKAAMSMCLWVRAMDTYATVYRIVEPKRQALAAAQAALDASNAALALKQQQLQAIKDKVTKLQQQLVDTQKQLAALQFQAELCNKRLGRAGKLTNLLGDELVRWGDAASELGERLHLLVGDALLAAAAVNYLGPYPGAYRSQLLARWCSSCSARDIPASQPFSLLSVLSNPVELLEWSCQGLPTDTVSVENGLIVTRGIRKPLIIDPQQQCARWIHTREGGQGLLTVRASDPNLLRLVEGAVRLGTPLLLDEVPEGSLPPGLEGLLQPQQPADTRRTGALTPLTVRVGAVAVEADPNFRMYMVTRLPNPTYLPEAATMVNLVNFTITRQGLEEQLLAELVRAERPELEESRDSLITSISADKRQLQQLEGKILRLLREASGNLLDDEVLISTLNTSKETSAVIQSRVREAELTELQINAARDEYRHPPCEAARLWFVVADLAALHPMYTASLSAFTAMFRHCIRNAPTAATLEARMSALVAFLQSFVHKLVSRGLKHDHKLVFSFVMAASGPRERGEVTAAQWDLLVKPGALAAAGAAPAASVSSPQHATAGGAAAGASSSNACSKGGRTQAPPAWCKAGLWAALGVLEASLPQQWQGLCAAVLGSSTSSSSAGSSCTTEVAAASWEHLMLHGNAADFLGAAARACSGGQTPTCHTDQAASADGPCLLDQLMATGCVGQQRQQQQQQQLRGDEDTSNSGSRNGTSDKELGLFARLLLLKACREDLLPAAMRAYVSNTLGPTFADPDHHAASLPDVFGDSSAVTPIVLTMAQGADAVAELGAFAATQGRAVGRGLQLLSLGQGQGPVAEAMVRVAMHNGDWVCLQNCHLAKSWMPQLVKLVEEIEAAATEAATAAAAAAPGGAGRRASTTATIAAVATTAVRQQALAAAPAAPQGFFLPEAPAEQQQQQGLHPGFRLWLTSSPVDFFPAAVLHRSVRLFLEPPRGLKPCLLGTYASLPSGCLSSCDSSGRGTAWRRLLFASALLHGLLTERRRFGPLGWVVPYEFTDGDLSCALSNIQAVVRDSSQELQQQHGDGSDGSSSGSSSGSSGVWEALLHIVGAINYGGRVTEPEDRRLLAAIMAQQLSPAVLGGKVVLGRPGHALTLEAPDSTDPAVVMAHLQRLQLPTAPELFGLHPNAATAVNRQEGQRLLQRVLRMQPATSAAASTATTTVAASTATAAARRSTADSRLAAAPPAFAQPVPAVTATAAAAAPVLQPLEVQVSGLIQLLLSQLPQQLDRQEASLLHDPFAALPDCGGRMNPLGVVLLQEMDRYNRLLGVVREGLLALQSACAGLTVLDAQGEAALTALAHNKLPRTWAAAAYPSSKPLAAWMADLVKRVTFIRQWLSTGQPHVFWLPGLFCPEAFLIAVLQRHALQSGGAVAIDRLTLGAAVLSGVPGPACVSAAPAAGVYVHGLYLEGARWDAAASCLCDPAPGEMVSPLPVLHLVPHEGTTQPLDPAVAGGGATNSSGSSSAAAVAGSDASSGSSGGGGSSSKSVYVSCVQDACEGWYADQHWAQQQFPDACGTAYSCQQQS